MAWLLAGSWVRILYVEDEPKLADPVRRNLDREGFAVDIADSLGAADAALSVARYDAILLDIGLPDGDGLTLVEGLRRRRDPVPVIALTARDGLDDRVSGLDRGVDDYLVKPFALQELLARLRAVLRRPGQFIAMRLTAGALTLDTVTGEVWVGETPLPLARRELTILELLMRRVGRVIQREGLEQGVYGFDADIGSNALEAHISRLRRRLTEARANVTIHGIRGVGYLLKPQT